MRTKQSENTESLATLCLDVWLSVRNFPSTYYGFRAAYRANNILQQLCIRLFAFVIVRFNFVRQVASLLTVFRFSHQTMRIAQSCKLYKHNSQQSRKHTELLMW